MYKSSTYTSWDGPSESEIRSRSTSSKLGLAAAGITPIIGALLASSAAPGEKRRATSSLLSTMGLGATGASLGAAILSKYGDKDALYGGLGGGALGAIAGYLLNRSLIKRDARQKLKSNFAKEREQLERINKGEEDFRNIDNGNAFISHLNPAIPTAVDVLAGDNKGGLVDRLANSRLRMSGLGLGAGIGAIGGAGLGLGLSNMMNLGSNAAVPAILLGTLAGGVGGGVLGYKTMKPVADKAEKEDIIADSQNDFDSGKRKARRILGIAEDGSEDNLI